MIRLLIIGMLMVSFIIITIPVALIAWIIGFINPAVRYNISIFAIRLLLNAVFFLTGSKLEVNGLENIPDEAALFIGNHNSYFDIVISYIIIKKRLGFIGKQELMKIPGINWWLILLDGLSLNRSDPRKGLEMVNKAASNITNGISMFIFPEGTRSKDGSLGDFKEGSFKIATKSNCKIVPVAITNTADIFENHLPFIRPAKVSISFGTPIETANLSRIEKKSLGATTRSCIQEMLLSK